MSATHASCICSNFKQPAAWLNVPLNGTPTTRPSNAPPATHPARFATGQQRIIAPPARRASICQQTAAWQIARLTTLKCLRGGCAKYAQEIARTATEVK